MIGAAGYIGTNLVKRLYDDVKDVTVIGIDNMIDYYDVRLKEVRLAELSVHPSFDKVDNPVSLYAATKKSNELMAHAYAKLYNIPLTGLRFLTVYGPAGRSDMAYFGFTDKLRAGKTIQIFNYGSCKRDFTYIDDIVTRGPGNLCGYISIGA